MCNISIYKNTNTLTYIHIYIYRCMFSWICRNMCWNVSLVPSPTYSWHTNKHKQTLLSHLLIDWTRDRNISPNSSDQLATCKDYTRPIFTKFSDDYFFDWNLTNMILFPTSLEHNVLNPFICSIKDYTHIYVPPGDPPSAALGAIPLGPRFSTRFGWSPVAWSWLKFGLPLWKGFLTWKIWVVDGCCHYGLFLFPLV